jgi:hypothetical protein
MEDLGINYLDKPVKVQHIEPGVTPNCKVGPERNPSDQNGFAGRQTLTSL